MGNQQKVKDPNVEVVTEHIRPIVQSEWKDRRPNENERRRIATVVNSLEGYDRKYSFTFGYDAYFINIKNASDKKNVHDWINPKNPHEAIKEGDDVKELASLIGLESPEIGSGHKVNLMTGNPLLASCYQQLLNTKKKNIRFLAITDQDKVGASSTTSRGDKLANIQMVDFIKEEDLEKLCSENNSSINQFTDE